MRVAVRERLEGGGDRSARLCAVVRGPRKVRMDDKATRPGGGRLTGARLPILEEKPYNYAQFLAVSIV